ncbi:organelle RRM domain-containing protein 2, mitochondrial-like [Syzygium oleosum]|uniref:organelle RRM domain-containing protein 2, mitochondrial-like n=1 Tax=Syzygium oleosum TaxID=219896 RepID=UPI0024B94D56|nr:organelle RRM domain-containing protein 2, mitochondrial-like [Syzygium oleosum]
MALRLGIARRLLSTSSFASQLSAPAATATAAAGDKPAPIPSDTLFVSGKALGLGIARRLLSTSSFASQLSAPAATAAAAAAAGDKPAPIPSDTLFVSGLNKRTTTEKLHEAFSKFGQVVHAKVVTDRNSGYSKGFGFVKYATLDDAAKGIEGMDAKFLDGWVIFAEYARPRPPPGQATSQDTYMPRSGY